MSDELKIGQVTFTGASPMQLAEHFEQRTSTLSDEQQSTVGQVGATVKAYLNAAKELLKDKYAHIKDWAPMHLAEPGNVLVACCQDGVVIRYELKTDKTLVCAAWLTEGLPEVASLLSQRIVQCDPDRNHTFAPATTGMELKLFIEDPGDKQKTDIASARVCFHKVVERPGHMPQPPKKPFCLLSVRNTLEIRLLGEMLGDGKSVAEGRRFLLRGALRLPVGWECIEVFPFFSLEHWKAEYADNWAESDLLAGVVARQFCEAQFQSLDPNAAARKEFGGLLKTYLDLLDSDPEREEILQTFLRDHPALLCPSHIRMWPKLALGSRETDFVFQEATGDYLLVELERSTYRLFLNNGHPSRQLNHARGQLTDWKRYLEDNLSTVQRELGLTEISANPRGLIVIGRSQSLTAGNRRKLITMENESPKLKIMTYDDVYENAKAVTENILGPLWETEGATQVYYLRGKGS